MGLQFGRRREEKRRRKAADGDKKDDFQFGERRKAGSVWNSVVATAATSAAVPFSTMFRKN